MHAHESLMKIKFEYIQSTTWEFKATRIDIFSFLQFVSDNRSVLSQLAIRSVVFLIVREYFFHSFRFDSVNV